MSETYEPVWMLTPRMAWHGDGPRDCGLAAAGEIATHEARHRGAYAAGVRVRDAGHEEVVIFYWRGPRGREAGGCGSESPLNGLTELPRRELRLRHM